MIAPNKRPGEPKKWIDMYMALFKFKPLKTDILMSLNVEVDQDATGAPKKKAEDQMAAESTQRVQNLMNELVRGLSVNSKQEFEALFA